MSPNCQGYIYIFIRNDYMTTWWPCTESLAIWLPRVKQEKCPSKLKLLKKVTNVKPFTSTGRWAGSNGSIWIKIMWQNLNLVTSRQDGGQGHSWTELANSIMTSPIWFASVPVIGSKVLSESFVRPTSVGQVAWSCNIPEGFLFRKVYEAWVRTGGSLCKSSEEAETGAKLKMFI